MDEEARDRIDVIGISEDKDLVSDASPIAVSYRETLYRAKGQEPTGEPVGTSMATCREVPGAMAVCTVELNMDGTDGFRKGRVIAVGTMPLADRALAAGRGTLTIVGGSGYNPAHGGTLDVEIWNPKKYSQTDP